MKDNNDIKKGYILVLLAGTCWGMMGVLTRGLSETGLNSFQIAALRPSVAVLFYVIYYLIRNPKIFKIDLRGLLFFLIYGVITLDGMFISFTYAVEYTSIATASVLLFTNPIMVIIMSRILFKEKFTKKKIMALILTIVGCFLIVKAYDQNALKLNLQGILWGILSGFTVALQNVLGKFGTKKYDYRTQITYSFIFAAIFLWFLSSPVQLLDSINNQKTLILVIAIGFFATVIPNGAFLKALQYIESSKASIITSVEPIVAALLGYFIYNEKLEFLQIIGIVTILIAVYFIQEKKTN